MSARFLPPLFVALCSMSPARAATIFTIQLPGSGSANFTTNTNSIELGVRFRSDVAGQITGLRFYKAAGNTGPHTGHLWTNTGTLLGSLTFTGETATGWQSANFAAPVAIQTGTTYVASYHTASYSVTPFAFAAAGIDNPPLHALQNGADGANGLYIYSSAAAFPSYSTRSSNYWVDVLFSATGSDVAPPTVSISSPIGGAAVRGTLAVLAAAADDVAVATVQFRLDGADLGPPDLSPPYATVWNTALSTDGAHGLSAVAWDAAGNASTSAVVSVTVDNTPPLVSSVAMPTTVVSLTFDDDMITQLLARDILDQKGVKGTFYIASGLIGLNATYMTSSQIQSIAAGGHEIGGHSVDHLHLGTLTSVQLQHQICDDRAALVAMGFNPVSFAYPYGEYNSAVKSMAANCGYQSGRASWGLGCLTCPAAGPIPPPDAFAIATEESLKNATTLAAMQKMVTDAEQAGGGWVPLIFHSICDNCGTYAVSPSTLAVFIDWVKLRAASGTVFKTVAEVMEVDSTVPAILGLNPSSATAGGAAFALQVLGSGFLSDSMVRWNGAGRPTTFVSSAALSALISSADIVSAGTAAVTVLNPSPGGVSSPSVFTIATGSDVAPPTVSISSPSGGAAVRGTLAVLAAAADDVAVATVQFRLDGADLGPPDLSPPYATVWNTALSTDGAHGLTAVAWDAAGNASTSAAVSVTVDNTPPVISSVAVASVSQSSTVVAWSTNEASTSQVEYGTSTAYGSATALDVATAIAHSRLLSGLSAGTLYHYRVGSADAAGNLAVSGDGSFTTSVFTGTAPTTVVSLTFDDDMITQLLARDILDQKGVKGTFYIASGLIGLNATYMTSSQIQSIAAGGHEIGGHSVDHLHLGTLTSEQLQHQICDDRAALVSMGFNPVSFAYPYGEYNSAVKSMAANCGYQSGRASWGLGCLTCPAAGPIPPPDAFAIATEGSLKNTTTLAVMQKMVTDAEQAGGGWVPLIFHSICDNCGTYAVSPSTLAAFIDWVKLREASGTAFKTVAEVMGAGVAPPTAAFMPPAAGALLQGTVAVAAGSFEFRDLYAFPNPSRRGERVTIRLQVGLADAVDVSIFDLSGRRVNSGSAAGPVLLDDGNGKGPQFTYDYHWDVSGAASAVYLYAVTAHKQGQAGIGRTGKVALIK